MVLQFFKASKPDAPEKKASAAAPVIAFHGAGRPIWSARDTVSLTKTGFVGNPIGFRCVKMIAEAAANIPWILSDGQKRFDQHPLLNLLNRPNQSQGRPELLENFFSQLMLTGNGYLEGAGVDPSKPTELYVLRSDRMRVVPGADGWPAAYEYSVGARKHLFDMQGDTSPICHVKFFNPHDDHYGLSPLQAAASAVDVHNSASRWSKSLLDNAARPSGAIVYRGADGHSTLGEDQYSRLLDEIEANHQGARNAGRPMLLEGGLDWKPMGFSPSDMEFLKTKEGAARDIALALGVPPMLLGLPGDNTYANYQEANRAFYRLTILPLVNKVTAALTNWIAQYHDQQLTFVADLDQIPALQNERDAQWRRVSEANFLTDLEKRKLLGLPEIDHSK